MTLAKIAQVDGYQQETEWSCSAATLKAVLNHYGHNIPEKEIIEAIGAREGRGAETTDIVQGAERLGFSAWEGSLSTLDAARRVLSQGIPIIADVQSFNYPGKGHYVVIAGYKPGRGFIIMDPNTKGKTAIPNWRVLPEEKLEEVWWDRAMAPPHELMPKWGVLVSPQKEKTANGDMMEYFQKNPRKFKEYQDRQQAKKKQAGDILGWSAQRRAKSESSRARDFGKYSGDILPSSERTLAVVETNESGRLHNEKNAGVVQLNAFFGELEKIGKSEVAEAAMMAAKILGLVGAAHGAATRKEDEGFLSSSIKGGARGALVGALVGAGLARRAGGKTTVPHPKTFAHQSSPGVLKRILSTLK